MNEQAMAIGQVEVRYFNEKGEMTRSKTFKNKLTFYSVQAMARLMVGESVITPSYIVLGTGAPAPPATGPSADDSALWIADATTKRTCDVKSTFLSTTSEFGVNYDLGEIAGTTYLEAGLFDDEDNMWAHVVVTIDQQATETTAVLWKVLHVGN